MAARGFSLTAAVCLFANSYYNLINNICPVRYRPISCALRGVPAASAAKYCKCSFGFTRLRLAASFPCT